MGETTACDLPVIPCVPVHMRVLDLQACLFGELSFFWSGSPEPHWSLLCLEKRRGPFPCGSLKGVFAGPAGDCVLGVTALLSLQCSPLVWRRLSISIEVLI